MSLLFLTGTIIWLLTGEVDAIWAKVREASGQNQGGSTKALFNLATVAMEISFLLTAGDYLMFEMWFMHILCESREAYL